MLYVLYVLYLRPPPHYVRKEERRRAVDVSRPRLCWVAPEHRDYFPKDGSLKALRVFLWSVRSRLLNSPRRFYGFAHAVAFTAIIRSLNTSLLSCCTCLIVSFFTWYTIWLARPTGVARLAVPQPHSINNATRSSTTGRRGQKDKRKRKRKKNGSPVTFQRVDTLHRP